MKKLCFTGTTSDRLLKKNEGCVFNLYITE